jgi:hypothetical protein
MTGLHASTGSDDLYRRQFRKGDIQSPAIGGKGTRGSQGESMQEGVVDEREAKRAASNWYLCRDGQQHGPLTDRELSLFAESGNFQPGDLLWTEGLDTWKPADAIFGHASSREAEQVGEAEETSTAEPSDQNNLDDPAAEPMETAFLAPAPEAEAPDTLDSEHVDALVQALKGETAPLKLDPKERFVAELKKFSGLCEYLWAVLALLALHAWVGEARYGGTFAFLW